MGIGATTADIDKLIAATKTQTELVAHHRSCAFACHATAEPKDNTFTSSCPRSDNKLRIDVVKEAMQAMTDTAAQMARQKGITDLYRMSLFSFNASCVESTSASTYVREISPMSANMATTKAAADGIALMTIARQEVNRHACSEMSAMLKKMKTTIESTAAQANRQKWLFVVSDGVAGEKMTCTASNANTLYPYQNGPSCIQPITPALCDDIKKSGTKIAVLYTTYWQIDKGNAGDINFYNVSVGRFNKGPFAPSTNSDIARNMKSCATSGFLFEVGPDQEIKEAMQQLFVKAANDLRLTQ